MLLLRSPACPLSRARPEANRPKRDRLSFRAARKVRRRVAESAAQSGSGRSSRPTSVRVLMALSRSRLDGDLPFFPVVQSAAVICRLWCVSLPYPHPSPTEISARSLRVALVVRVVIIVIFLFSAVVFVFLFFLVWLLSP